MDLYLTKYGTKLSRRSNSFLVISEDKSYMLSPDKIETIILEANIGITSEAIKLAIEKDVAIILTDEYGNMLGHFCKMNYSKGGKLRKKQYEFFTKDEGLNLAKEWVIQKIEKQKSHVDYLLKKRRLENPSLKKFDDAIARIKMVKINWDDYRDKIRGVEGNISRLYYKIISDLLDNKWKFDVREHRNAKYPYNIVLNYTFGILYRMIEVIIVREGFDPAMGIIHIEGEKKTCFVYDFIEKFRYLAFESTFKMFYDKVIKKDFFEENEKNRKVLSLSGRREISSFFKDILKKGEKIKGKNYSIESIIKYEIKKLKKELLKDFESLEENSEESDEE